MDIVEVLKTNRPNLAPSSLKTYNSILKNLHKACYHDKEMCMKDFDNTETILGHLKDFPHQKRKTILAALVVLTGNKCYQKDMMNDIEHYQAKQLEQKKDGKFAENMISPEEVDEILLKHQKIADSIYKKKAYHMKDYQEIMNYILLCLTSGIYNEPRRSKDWEMRFRNYDPETENYCDIKKKLFVYNDFKTKSSKGRQEFAIPDSLLKILKKWIKILPSDQDYLLFDTTNKPLTPSQITHRLNNIFGKNISTSMLRHIYLTKKFGNVNLQDIVDTANKMGNSLQTALEYVKK